MNKYFPKEIKKIIYMMLESRLTAFDMCGQGRFCERNLKTLFIGKESQLLHISSLLYEASPTCQKKKSVFIWNIKSYLRQFVGMTDFVVIDCHTRMTVFLGSLPEFFSTERLLLNEWDISDPIETIERALKRHAEGDLQRIRRHGYTYEITREKKALKSFYKTMLVPYLSKQYQKRMVLESFEQYLKRANEGTLLVVKRDGKAVSGTLFEVSGQILTTIHTGLKDGDNHLKKEGAVAAAYYFIMKYAKEKGYQKIKKGASPCNLSDGLSKYKAKWGTRLVRIQDFERQLFVKPAQCGDAVIQYFSNNPMVFFQDKQVCAVTAFDGGEPMHPNKVGKLIKRRHRRGVENWVLISPQGFCKEESDNVDVKRDYEIFLVNPQHQSNVAEWFQTPLNEIKKSSNESIATLEELNPEEVFEVKDSNLGILGYIIIDTSIGQRAGGSIIGDADMNSTDLAHIARTMSLKYGFLNLEKGGAKAAVLAPETLSAQERQQWFLAFGKQVRELLKTGRYSGGAGTGLSNEDYANLMHGAGKNIGVKAEERKKPLRESSEKRSPLKDSALTVLTAAERLFHHKGIHLRGATIGIEGLGRLGGEVARSFFNAGAIIQAIHTSKGAIYREKGLDIPQLINIRQRYKDEWLNHVDGATTIPSEEFYRLNIDCLILCAASWTLFAERARHLKATIVIAGANAPVTPQAEKQLWRKGIWYVPDFVASGGAALVGHLRGYGFEANDVEKIIHNRFGRMISKVIEISAKEKRSFADTAHEIAKRRIKRMKEYDRRWTTSGGWIPVWRIRRIWQKGASRLVRLALSIIYRRSGRLKKTLAPFIYLEVRRIFSLK